MEKNRFSRVGVREMTDHFRGSTENLKCIYKDVRGVHEKRVLVLGERGEVQDTENPERKNIPIHVLQFICYTYTYIYGV